MSQHAKHGVPPIAEQPETSPKPLEILQKQTFEGLDIKQNILDVLTKLGFTHPTPIQAKTIPMGISGSDVLGIAQTGTGKTLAFGIPMAQKLSTTQGNGLILVPTRELALQVHETMGRLCNAMNIPTVLVIGGESMQRQIQNLKRNPRIIIATPGRLNDHIRQRVVKLDRISVLVLDEADRMLDMGFAPQIKEIIKHTPPDRQTLLFSATMPAELTKLAHSFMKEPLRVDIAPQGSTIALVSQELFFVPKPLKPALLMNLLEQYQGSVLVFTRTKFGAKRIAEALRLKNISSAEIHSNRSQAQRKAALEGFKRGTFRVLVATDIAARGIHVSDIEVVINYDLPEQTSDYVHRIGRTGRAGKTGHAISFASPDQKQDVRDIERLIKKLLKVTTLPKLPNDVYLPATVYEEAPRGGRSQGGRGGFGGGRGAARPFTKSGYGTRDARPSTGGFSKPFASRPASGAPAKPYNKYDDNKDFRPSSSTGSYSKPKSQYVGRDSRPATGGYGARPSTGGYGKPAGEYGSRPTTGSYGARPSTGDYAKPKGEYGSRPATGSYGSRPASTGGYGKPSGSYGSRPASTGGYSKPGTSASRPSTGESRKFTPRRPDRNNRNKYPSGFAKSDSSR